MKPSSKRPGVATLIALAVLTLQAACSSPRSGVTCETYAEAADPDTSGADWSTVKGLQCAFGSIDQRYPRSAPPAIGQATDWKGVGWRGETISAQLVLWSDRPVEGIAVAFSPFRSAEGHTLPGFGQARFVRYVLTDVFAPGCGFRKPEDFPVSLSADVLDHTTCLDMAARTTQPVWLTFAIPADAVPGVYEGTVTIQSLNQPDHTMSVAVEVLPMTLPPAREWAFHLDLWQHPTAVARVHGVPVWSDAHWTLLETPMRMLANAGQKVITATLNKDPWNNQCFDPYADMIAWTRNTDGSWAYDFSVFDRWVSFMMQLGVDKQINCYSLLPWNHEIHYVDARTGDTVNVSAVPGSDTFTELWTPFLRAFRQHLQDKGWLAITNIAMDERSPEEMKAALSLLNTVAPELGVALADNHKSYQQYPMLKDICVAFGADFAPDDLAFRKANGLISTYYVCCADEFPNVFTFSDPAEAVFMGWYAMAAGLDGYLHWSYNSWTEHPLTDSRFRTWPAGDTYVIYPEGRSSIRFERMREGIQDAEKIRILRERFAVDPTRLSALETVLTSFHIKTRPDSSCAGLVNAGKQVLRELSLTAD